MNALVPCAVFWMRCEPRGTRESRCDVEGRKHRTTLYHRQAKTLFFPKDKSVCTCYLFSPSLSSSSENAYQYSLFENPTLVACTIHRLLQSVRSTHEAVDKLLLRWGFTSNELALHPAPTSLSPPNSARSNVAEQPLRIQAEV